MSDKLIIIILLIVLGVLMFLVFFYKRKSKKEYFRGQNELFQLLLASGYESKVNQFKVYNEYVEVGNIVFIGDSITQDYNVHEFFPHLKVYNRGIGGDTTVGLLKRLKESVFDLKPNTVVLLIGTNDLALLNATPYQIYLNIKKIVYLILEKLPDTQIILQSVYPISREHHPKIDLGSVNKRENKVIDDINNLIKSIEHVEYVDVNTILKDEQGNLKLDYTVEGLHLSPLGYKIVTDTLNSMITIK